MKKRKASVVSSKRKKQKCKPNIRELQDSKTRKEAEKLVHALTVDVTGARENDVLIGVGKTVKNAQLQILGSIFPEQQALNKIRLFPDLWREFLISLGSIPFFQPMSVDERTAWLLTIEDKKYENKIGGYPSCTMWLLQPGEKNTF